METGHDVSTTDDSRDRHAVPQAFPENDEIGLNACDDGCAVLDGLGMAVAGDGNFQSRLCHCFSIPAFSITAAHFLTSAAMRSRISSGVLPRASMPNADAVAWTDGSASAVLTS